ncbi:PilN domain-containing protein [Yersinia sp. Marseille-Q3913]|uniref:PilN domain-containing protein n=1 Tax=Yersinia sp. Marseille-Q3913 TaxID=2830769 RepID=UPI001BAE9554|nr:PilN domain-containing protein [Yersinia sp. Marseille-Q3913]MBS0056667.1 PilN domain-containing protein [Yersinia sp. Marseille-Q3913]
MYQVNFSLWRTERLLARYRFWRNAGLCQCSLLVITLVFTLMQSHGVQTRQQGSLVELTQQQGALIQHHQEVQRAMVQLQQTEQRVQIYRQVHQSARRYATLLQQLSQQIPDSCWLVSLMPQGDRVVLEAISQEYAAINSFLVQLGRQSLLANVRLQKIAQQDDGNFRFAVWADWQSGEANHE